MKYKFDFLKKKKTKIKKKKKADSWIQRFLRLLKKGGNKKTKRNFFNFYSKKRGIKKNINKKTEGSALSSILVLSALGLTVFAIIFQLIFIVNSLVSIEAFENSQKFRLEIENIKINIAEMDAVINNSLDELRWNDLESKKYLAKNIRDLDFLNVHLLKTIEAYDKDFSLQLFKNRLVVLERIAQESRNIYLISDRLANKIDTLLLFKELDDVQRSLLEKDLNLFYEKVDLIKNNPSYE